MLIALVNVDVVFYSLASILNSVFKFVGLSLDIMTPNDFTLVISYIHTTYTRRYSIFFYV
jgi:hypothetical protein